MKKTHLLLFLFAIGLSILKAQTNSNHPSIQTVTVSYRAMAQSGQSIGQGITGFPCAKVALKPGNNAAIIYFKISNATTNTVIYQSSYGIGSAAVMSEGNTLFDNSNGILTLGYDHALPIKPYKYELWTEDAQHNASPAFLLTR